MRDIPEDANCLIEYDISELKRIATNLERQSWERKSSAMRKAASIIRHTATILESQMNTSRKKASPF